MSISWSHGALAQPVEAARLARRIAVVLKGYPRLSETFIAQEIEGLEHRGLIIDIISLRHPTDAHIHETHRRIQASVTYLPEYLRDDPLRVLRALVGCLVRQRFWPTLALWLADLWRDRTLNRMRRFGQALVLASEMDRRTSWLYGHFLHTPGSVTRYAARLTGLPFSLSAHAKDIWTIADWEIREKLADARWTVCCTRSNTEHLRQLCPSARVELLYHGLDLAEFPASTHVHVEDGSHSNAPVRIICVARAVEKKGVDVLIEALASLPGGLAWRLTHIGGGAQIERLRARAREAGIEERVAWRGAQPRDVVLKEMRRADIMALAARVAGDGDRDGLPNVLLEGLTQQLAVVATPVGGITELIEHGRTGLIVPSDDAKGLAAAIERLIGDPALRARLGSAGREVVERDLDARPGLDRLAALLQEGPEP